MIWESSPPKKIAGKWIGEFKRGRTSTNDAEQLERPKDEPLYTRIETTSKTVGRTRWKKKKQLTATITSTSNLF